MADMLQPSDPEDDDPPPVEAPWLTRVASSSSSSNAVVGPPAKRLAPMRQGTLKLAGTALPKPTPVPEGGWLFVVRPTPSRHRRRTG